MCIHFNKVKQNRLDVQGLFLFCSLTQLKVETASSNFGVLLFQEFQPISCLAVMFSPLLFSLEKNRPNLGQTIWHKLRFITLQELLQDTSGLCCSEGYWGHTGAKQDSSKPHGNFNVFNEIWCYILE